jgi:hypothetical protein
VCTLFIFVPLVAGHRSNVVAPCSAARHKRHPIETLFYFANRFSLLPPLHLPISLFPPFPPVRILHFPICVFSCFCVPSFRSPATLQIAFFSPSPAPPHNPPFPPQKPRDCIPWGTTPHPAAEVELHASPSTAVSAPYTSEKATLLTFTTICAATTRSPAARKWYGGDKHPRPNRLPLQIHGKRPGDAPYHTHETECRSHAHGCSGEDAKNARARSFAAGDCRCTRLQRHYGPKPLAENTQGASRREHAKPETCHSKGCSPRWRGLRPNLRSVARGSQFEIYTR